MAYCHCSDWRRSTGAPVAAFAAFDEAAVLPDLPGHVLQIGGVRRWTCATCAAPLGAAFDDRPGQVYVPVGIIEEAGALAPERHSHHAARPGWLHIDDNLPRSGETARTDLPGSVP